MPGLGEWRDWINADLAHHAASMVVTGSPWANACWLSRLHDAIDMLRHELVSTLSSDELTRKVAEAPTREQRDPAAAFPELSDVLIELALCKQSGLRVALVHWHESRLPNSAWGAAFSTSASSSTATEQPDSFSLSA